MNDNDMISRAVLLDDLSYCAPELWRDEEYIKAKIMKQPAVDAVPVVHARWIDENPDDSLDPRMRCSFCTGVESPLIKWRYCPNCGAKMIGESDG